MFRLMFYISRFCVWVPKSRIINVAIFENIYIPVLVLRGNIIIRTKYD